MPKNKPTLDAKAWEFIWGEYGKIAGQSLGVYFIYNISKLAKKKIQRIVNAELRRKSNATK